MNRINPEGFVLPGRRGLIVSNQHGVSSSGTMTEFAKRVDSLCHWYGVFPEPVASQGSLKRELNTDHTDGTKTDKETMILSFYPRNPCHPWLKSSSLIHARTGDPAADRFEFLSGFPGRFP